ncbi:MAG: hypothetical protein EOQ56_34115 [Mesorhizobium sp.]|nr:MAG: hypothetical protein EOQ56_34115 [Mesorhizobium sp.]
MVKEAKKPEVLSALEGIKGYIADFHDQYEGPAEAFRKDHDAWPIAKWFALGIAPRMDGPMLDLVGEGIMLLKPYGGYATVSNLDDIVNFVAWFQWAKKHLRG